LQDVHALEYWRQLKERFVVPISVYNKSDLVLFEAFALLLEVFDTVYWTTLAKINRLRRKSVFRVIPFAGIFRCILGVCW
jgi:hypothetical protein